MDQANAVTVSSFPPLGYLMPIHPMDEGVAPRAHFQEWFSFAFVTSICASTGFIAINRTPDVNQVDLAIETFHKYKGRVRTIGIQLKSTYSPKFIRDGEFISHQLEAKRYNRLIESSTIPRFFVLVAVTNPGNALTTCKEVSAEIRAAAWWTKVDGEPTSQGSKTIRVPTNQRFDAAALEKMMDFA